jgi:phosphatidylglycerophosphate synthase
MGHYRAADAVAVPSLISWLRLPLAASFPLVVSTPILALVVLVVAGLTDVLDGWWARRFGQATATGAVIDPITDKIFVLTVAVTLITTDHLAPTEVLLLSTRELGELPLVAWFTVSPGARRARAREPRANVPGKIATAAQFVAVTAALFQARHTTLWVGLTAALGTIAAATYWARALRARDLQERTRHV